MKRLLGLILMLTVCTAAWADTPLTLFKSWAGNVNFTGTVVTMRNSASDVCSVYPATTALSVPLAGIPANATVLSAQLYWAGSSSTPDYTVGFESANVTSTTARSYTSSSVGNGFNYFSGAVDVTAQVKARGNGDYQFYGLTVNAGSPYCASQAVVSGFNLLVVYSDANQPYRVLNLYEGFQYFQNTSYTTTVSNLRIPSPLPAGSTGRIGHITWEGDPNPATNGGEDISFNGTKMTDSLNPSGNQFNSKSNINGNTASYGLDFDAYTVAAPVIQAGQTSATTLYASGNDMVLLSAQIVAVPSVPAVDLSLNITRSGTFQAGTSGTFNLSVYNAGPNTETGPITLVTNLPAGLSYVSGTGTRWTCSASGQVVTCKYNGLFTPNTYLPDVTLTVLPTAEGSMTTTASVSGVDYDFVTGNNSDSDTTTVAKGAVSYVFTDSLCKPGVRFGTTGQCGLLTPDQRLPAALSVDGYLTSLTGGVPTARSTTAATTVPINFAMTCVLPLKNAGVKPTINGTALPLCADGPNAPVAASTAFSGAINLVFAANVPSSKITFFYADVGKVLLSVKDAAGNLSTSSTVIFRPIWLSLAVDGNVPGTITSTSTPYRVAGAPFPLIVKAVMANNAFAPNFGNGDASIALVPSLIPLTSTSTADDKAIVAAMGNMPDLVTTGMDKGSGGTFTGTAAFNEVGVIMLTASVDGGYFGVDDVTDATQKVGRFWLASFRTIVTPIFPDCKKIFAACLATTPGAAYATQAFDVAVTPLDANNKEVLNFRGVLGDVIKLQAFNSAGGTVANPPTGAALVAADIPALKATETNALLHTSVVYTLPVPFDRTKPGVTTWTAPTPIFLRANATDTPATPTAPALIVTSKQAGTSLEDGITILNGRLLLATVTGSELLRLPVTMKAQFWLPGGGIGAWTVNSQDNSATPTAIAFSTCKRNLLVANACYSELKIGTRDTVFVAGQARLALAPPGAGRTGSAMFNMTGAPAWLPSTLAQAVFGGYKSNFIYVREVF